MKIKKESIQPFLMKNALNPCFTTSIRQGDYALNGDPNINALKKELLFKKDCGLNIGDELVFIFNDATTHSMVLLEVQYTYTMEEYDDFSIKAVRKGLVINNIHDEPSSNSIA